LQFVTAAEEPVPMGKAQALGTRKRSRMQRILQEMDGVNPDFQGSERALLTMMTPLTRAYTRHALTKLRLNLATLNAFPADTDIEDWVYSAVRDALNMLPAHESLKQLMRDRISSPSYMELVVKTVSSDTLLIGPYSQIR
jgi:hypothetical protein